MLDFHISVYIERSQGRNASQLPGGRNRCRSHGTLLLREQNQVMRCVGKYLYQRHHLRKLGERDSSKGVYLAPARP